MHGHVQGMLALDTSSTDSLPNFCKLVRPHYQLTADGRGAGLPHCQPEGVVFLGLHELAGPVVVRGRRGVFSRGSEGVTHQTAPGSQERKSSLTLVKTHI